MISFYIALLLSQPTHVNADRMDLTARMVVSNRTILMESTKCHYISLMPHSLLVASLSCEEQGWNRSLVLHTDA